MSRIYEALKSAQEFAATKRLSAPANPDAAKVAPMHERRRQKRAGVRLAARIRPADPKDGLFEEILWTLNSSRVGVYCTTERQHYYPGMRLRVAFPYHSAHDRATASEDAGELLRLMPLPQGRVGIAVLLRGPAHPENLVGTRSCGSVKALGERRFAIRQPFTAAAIITSAHAHVRLQARSADLSANGCYIDTMNPYPEGTCVRLQLARGEKIFEIAATIRCSHSGMGMGLAFLHPTPEQESLLAEWLSQEPASYYAAS